MSKENREINNRFWDEFHHNGWSTVMPEPSEKDDLDTYSLDILVEYKVTCYARVSTNKAGMSVNGHLGVLWIDARHEVDPPYDFSIAEEVLEAISYAESNLVKIGIPFCPDYQFHGFDFVSNGAINRKTRREWRLEEIEETLNKEIAADKEAEIIKIKDKREQKLNEGKDQKGEK